jgi:anhydro-N-acetylmuramic acid kinase
MKGKGLEAAVWVLGTMSGTSLDGVDAAMVLTDGIRVLEFGPHAYRPYSAAEQATIRTAFGQWPGDPDVDAAAEVVEAAHIELISRFSNVALVGFHGQTLAHDPGGRGTHQAGNGAVLAEVLGLSVVWDFRSADVELGGQGAPLVPFFHHALARMIGASEPIAFLNLGGVGNLTWVDPRVEKPDARGALLAFDTGPANAPLNDLMLARLGRVQDEGGTLALSGTPDASVVAAFLAHPYFYRMPPKSLDRNSFPDLLASVQNLGDADALATLTACAAAAVAKGAEHFPENIAQLLVAGGGRHNAALMQALTQLLPNVSPVETHGLNGDMLEAQAFAYLAARVKAGLPTSCASTTGVPAAVGGGKISLP